MPTSSRHQIIFPSEEEAFHQVGFVNNLVDATTAPKRRRVRFRRTTSVVFIETSHEYSDEERDMSWYTKREYLDLKKDAKNTVRYFLLLHRKSALAKRQGVAGEEEHNKDNDARRKVDDELSKILCPRGLEHMLSPTVMRERRTAKTDVIKAVLAEQERQRDEADRDAAASSDVSSSAGDVTSPNSASSTSSLFFSMDDCDRASVASSACTSLDLRAWRGRRPEAVNLIAAASRLRSEGARRWALERGALDAQVANMLEEDDRQQGDDGKSSHEKRSPSQQEDRCKATTTSGTAGCAANEEDNKVTSSISRSVASSLDEGRHHTSAGMQILAALSKKKPEQQNAAAAARTVDARRKALVASLVEGNNNEGFKLLSQKPVLLSKPTRKKDENWNDNESPASAAASAASGITENRASIGGRRRRSEAAGRRGESSVKTLRNALSLLLSET